MGTSIIDAFVVTFGLDAREYKSGARDARKSFREVKDEAKGTFDDVEKRGKGAASSIRGVQNQVAGLFLFLAGANSLKNFAENLLTGAANADRLGETLGMSASRITGWQVAIKEMGGSAEDANGALQKMQDIIWQFKLGGGADPGLAAFGINPGDLQSGDPEHLLMKLAEARGRFSAQEYAKRLQLLGLPQSVVYALEKGSVALRKQVDEGEKHANVTKRDAEEAKRLQKALADLEATISGQARPALTNFVSGLNDFLTSTDSANIAIPIMVGGLGALTVAALSAAGPWLALAGAIGAVYAGLNHLILSNPEVRKVLDNIEAPLRRFLPDWMFKRPGDPDSPGGASSGASPGATAGAYIGGMAGGGGGIGTAGGGKLTPLQLRVMTSLMSYGIDSSVARGIVAGITAEGGGPNVVNPTSGAFGIGQWLGGRKRELMKRYGRNPTLDQQIQFLVWELNGGDHAGKSVLRQNNAVGAMQTYLRDFMRPGNGLSGDLARGYRDLGMNYRGGGGRGGGTTTIGSIVVNTKATDAKGIARDIGSALRDRAIVTQAAVGLTP